METNKAKCAKCFYEMDKGKYKTCNKCREYMRQNHQKNKEKRNERRMEHYRNHLDEAKEYARNYQQKNSEKIKEHYKEKIVCPVCKWSMQRGNWSKHIKTGIHLLNVEKEKEQEQVEPKVFTNQNILNTQYELTANYLCCDE